MNRWLNHLWRILARLLLSEAQRRAIRQAQIQGIKTYLKVLQGIRLTAIGILALLLVIQFVALGFFTMLGALLWLAPWDAETKAWVVLGVGATLFFVPVLAVGYALSERVWYRASGADRMVKEVLD